MNRRQIKQTIVALDCSDKLPVSGAGWLTGLRQRFQRWTLLSLKSDLEHQLDADFDPEVSAALDSILFLLEVRP